MKHGFTFLIPSSAPPVVSAELTKLSEVISASMSRLSGNDLAPYCNIGYEWFETGRAGVTTKAAATTGKA